MSTPPMNRAQKRQLQKMGAMTAGRARPHAAHRADAAPEGGADRLRQFLREVRAELRKVVWPSREEVRNYSIIVLITVVVFTAFVAVLDYLFGSATLWLYDR